MALVAVAGCAMAQPSGSGCTAIRQDYQAALIKAQVACTGTGAPICTARRVAAPDDACHCQVAVDPAHAATLDALLAKFQSNTCSFEPLFCTNACIIPVDR